MSRPLTLGYAVLLSALLSLTCIRSATSVASPSTNYPANPAPVPDGWGTIKGAVGFDGDIPERKLLHKKGDMAVKDSAVCAAADMYSDELVINKKTKGVQWVVVYVAGKPAIHPALEKVDGTVELGQKHCVFKPHVLCYRQGQKLKISSEDPVSHNANVQPLRGNGSNILMPAAVAGDKIVVDGPDLPAQSRPFPINCNIHKWMTAYMMVLDHPYFAVTDENGLFEIKNVPAGTLKLVSWQESVGWLDGGRSGIDVEVKPDAVTHVVLTMKPTK